MLPHWGPFQLVIGLSPRGPEDVEKLGQLSTSFQPLMADDDCMSSGIHKTFLDEYLGLQKR